MGTSQSPELTPGITLTKHAGFHEIQLIFRHSNNRYKQEMPSDHHLHQFSLDGTGLKSPAHPLTITRHLQSISSPQGFPCS